MTAARPHYRVIVMRPLLEPFDDAEREKFEANVAENLNQQHADGYTIVAIIAHQDTIVYTFERTP